MGNECCVRGKEDLANYDTGIERMKDKNEQNLPKEKGKEVFANNAPMQRGVYTNGVGIVTCGLTQYEVFKRELRLPILRATGLISNPENPARTTPAGPPIEVHDLQRLGFNQVNFSVFLNDNLEDEIQTIFSKCVVF